MNRTTVLIVEDEAIVAADLAGKLGLLGYEVSGIAAQGEEAVELACSLRPAIVLMDIRLKGAMDGIEAAEAIQRRYDVPVIYLTAHSDAATLERAKLSQPFGYILKPFEERELSTTIKMAIYKHQSDRQLREQREWLRVTLTSIGDAVITCDTDGRVNFINPVAEELTGWSIAEARDRPIGEVFRLVDELTGKPSPDPADLVLREGSPMVLADNTALVTRAGREIPIEDSAAPILGADGRVVGVVLVFHDVTEKRRAVDALKERDIRLRRAEEMAHLGHWRFDLVTGRVAWSDEVYRIFGLRRDGGPDGHSIANISAYCHPDDLKQCLQSFDPLGRASGTALEYRIIRPDGEERHVVSNGEVVRDEAGLPVALFGTLLDVTELRRNERELQDKNTQLERFTYMISHDMKSPLVTLKTFLGFLGVDLAKNDTGRIEKDMHYMRGAADRMGRLLEELLEMLRVGRATNQPERVACRDLVEEALALVAGPVAERGVEVLNSVPDITLFGDRPRLVEIWQNLVENACKFMGGQAAPRIEIGAEERGRETLFFVRDNGVGIEPRYHEKIFGLFEKLDRHSEGTGLGLALVRRIVELNGGRIRVESRGTGQGACFLFSLPGALNPSPHERMRAAERGETEEVTGPRRSEPPPTPVCPDRG